MGKSGNSGATRFSKKFLIIIIVIVKAAHVT